MMRTLFAALASLLLAACGPALPKDYNGWWTGQSEGGNAITFQVVDGAVQDLKIGMGNMRCSGSLTWSGSQRVRKQQLQIDVSESKQLEGAGSLFLSGTFLSDHAVRGEVRAMMTGDVTNPACAGMAEGKWSAVRDAWRAAHPDTK